MLSTPPRIRHYTCTIEPHRGSLFHRWCWTVRVHNANPDLPILWATGSTLSHTGAEAAARRAVRRHRVYLERILQSAREIRATRAVA